MTYFYKFKQERHAEATARLPTKPDWFKSLNVCVHIHFNHHKMKRKWEKGGIWSMQGTVEF